MGYFFVICHHSKSIGTDQGVYYHDTILNSWVFYNTGLPMVMVADLKIYEPGEQLIAATYGRGTWETPLYSSITCNLVATTTGTNISCHGENNGSAAAFLTGGTSPFTYSWSGGGTNSN